MRTTKVSRRPDYQPAGPPEEFIVPLLGSEIEKFIEAFLVARVDGAFVLDVGCGRQPFRGVFEEAGLKYVGLDVEQNPEGSVEFVCGIDKGIPDELISSGPFDLILCTEVLEHVAFWDVAFENFKTLLAKGGTILITCPFFYQLHEEPFDFWRPTAHCLETYAARFGFDVQTRQLGDTWDVLGTALGNCRCQPRKRTFIRRIFSKLTEKGLRLFFHILRLRWIQRQVEIKAPLYLSNLAILRVSDTSSA
ncbi:MAG: class I SAM-dependent methyltransferase [Verrucomicrobiota bacterium]